MNFSLTKSQGFSQRPAQTNRTLDRRVASLSGLKKASTEVDLIKQKTLREGKEYWRRLHRITNAYEKNTIKNLLRINLLPCSHKQSQRSHVVQLKRELI